MILFLSFSHKIEVVLRQILVAFIALHLIYHLDLPCEEILILELVVLEQSRVTLFLLLELLLFYNVQ